MDIRIEYCVRWNYLPQATGLAAEVRAAFPETEISTELVQGDKGAFEVWCDGKLVFSKLSKGRFPAYQEIPALLLGP